MQTERGNVFANRRRTTLLRLSGSSASLCLKLPETYLRALVRSRVQVRGIVGVLANIVVVVDCCCVGVVVAGVVIFTRVKGRKEVVFLVDSFLGLSAGLHQKIIDRL